MKDKLIKLLQENLIERKILVDLLREDVEELDEAGLIRKAMLKTGLAKPTSVGKIKSRIMNARDELLVDADKFPPVGEYLKNLMRRKIDPKLKQKVLSIIANRIEKKNRELDGLNASLHSTIRIQKELNKYKVGKVYLIQSYDGEKLNSVRLKVTKIEKGPLKDWIKYAGKDVIRSIMKDNDVGEDEPSEFIRFDLIHFSLSKTLSKALSQKKFFVYEGIKIPIFYSKYPERFKKVIDPRKYSFLILNTSLLKSSYQAAKRGRDLDSNFWDRLFQNYNIIHDVNEFEKYLDTLDMNKTSLEGDFV